MNPKLRTGELNFFLLGGNVKRMCSRTVRINQYNGGSVKK
jgi:hypothetical protein